MELKKKHPDSQKNEKEKTLKETGIGRYLKEKFRKNCGGVEPEGRRKG